MVHERKIGADVMSECDAPHADDAKASLPNAGPARGSLADILDDLSQSQQSHLTLREVTEAFGDKSAGASLAVFAIPNLMPLPPGSTLIFGLPLLFVSWQMAVRAGGVLTFPDRLANCRIERETFAALTARAIPYLRMMERWLKPRFAFAGRRIAERLLGMFALLLATVVFLPIPMGNWLPALALAVIGLTLSARDGLGLMAGVVIGIISIGFVAVTVLATGAAIAYFI